MNNRILGYDIARTLAIFGMVIVNYKQVMVSGVHDPDWLARITRLMEGRASALFVILVGAGISLLTQRGRINQDHTLLIQGRNILLKRSAFLFIAGLLFFNVWRGDILHYYGIYLIFAVLALPATNIRLLIYSGVSIVLFVVLFFILDYEKGWDDAITYSSFWTLEGAIRNMFFNGYHPVFPWVSFLFLGMFIGRLNVSTVLNQKRLFIIGISSALVAEILSRFLIRYVFTDDQVMIFDVPVHVLLGTDLMPPTPLYVISSAGTAIALIAVACAIGERFSHTGLLRPIVATGQLALTIYVAHVIIGMGFLTLIDRISHQTLPFAVIVALIFCAGSILLSFLWLQNFKRGPLEVMMRRITG